MCIEETVKIVMSKQNQDMILSEEEGNWVNEELILGISNDGNWLIDVDDVSALIGLLADFKITEFDIVEAEADDFPDEDED